MKILLLSLSIFIILEYQAFVATANEFKDDENVHQINSIKSLLGLKMYRTGPTTRTSTRASTISTIIQNTTSEAEYSTKENSSDEAENSTTLFELELEEGINTTHLPYGTTILTTLSQQDENEKESGDSEAPTMEPSTSIVNDDDNNEDNLSTTPVTTLDTTSTLLNEEYSGTTKMPEEFSTILNEENTQKATEDIATTSATTANIEIIETTTPLDIEQHLHDMVFENEQFNITERKESEIVESNDNENLNETHDASVRDSVHQPR